MSFLCIEFANSWWSLVCRQFSDTQKTKEWLTQLAGKWDIGPLPELSDDDVKRLLEIRKSFEALLKRATEGPLSAPDIKLVNGYMSEVSFFRQLRAERIPRAVRCSEREGLELVYGGSGSFLLEALCFR